MKLAIPREGNDPRVALTPDAVAKLSELGVEVCVEKGAGQGAFYADDDYDGVTVLDRDALLKSADMVLSIHPLPDEDLAKLSPETVVIAEFKPFADAEITDRLRGHKLKAFSLDMIPRNPWTSFPPWPPSQATRRCSKPAASFPAISQ